MVLHLRMPHSAEVDGVEGAEDIQGIFRHHPAVPLVVVAAGEIEVLEIQRDTEALGGDLEHAKAFRHYFATDAIAGHYGNLVTHGNVS